MAKMYPKMRSTVVEVMGDYYYQEMKAEEAMDLVFKEMEAGKLVQNDGNIDHFVSECMNTPIKLDKPQYQITYQEKFLEDQSLLIIKHHHSFSDGASLLSFINATSDNFDVKALFPIKNVPFMHQLLLKLSVPLYLPRIFIGFLTSSLKKNPLHDGKRILSGHRMIKTSKFFSFDDVKNAAHAYNITINDLITSCLATSVKQYFISKGDTTTDSINLVIPASIRFGNYPTMEQVELQNKFAVVPLKLPLDADLHESFKKVSHATYMFKHSFGSVYTTYVMTKFATALLPYFFSQWYVNYSSLAFTLAFTNIPGLIKPVTLHGAQQKFGQCYVQTSGRCGMTVSAMSYLGKYRVTVNVDETIMKEPNEIIALIEQNIDEALKGVTQKS